MSRYPVIYAEDALRYLKARQLNDDSVRLEDIRRTSGPGEDISNVPLEDLRERLLKLKRRFPASMRKRDPQGGKFESEACSVVHACLAGVDRQALADHDFWTWLAVDRLADIVEWRFGANGGPAEAKNYGIGTRSENMLFRLWLRADLGKSTGPDPYEFARLGDQELWRSHILRQGYAAARSVVRSLLKLQAGRLSVNGKAVKALYSGDDKNEGIRVLARRLKRMRANIIFEYLSPQQADALVFELSSDLKKGK